MRGRARVQLGRLLRAKLVTARAWALKDLFEHFWAYRSVWGAGRFLEFWTWRALRSRIKPMMQVASTLRMHRELIMNWFRAKGEISAGAVTILRNQSYLRRFSGREFAQLVTKVRPLSIVLDDLRGNCTSADPS